MVDAAGAGAQRRARLHPVDRRRARWSPRSAAEGVVTSSRDDKLRISAHCYNTAEDVQAVLDVLAANRRLLA